ncbi:MAG: peptidase M61 [Caulobacter sp.]|nr:peptidase M61 [Caulobacter sp.]
MLLTRIASVLALTVLLAGPSIAQDSPGPRPSPMPPAIPEARDVAFPGTMTLSVDATDLDRRIFRVKQTIPVATAGPMVLLYPEWLPGKHAARGELEKVAGLMITAGGKPVKWVRDPVDVFALHVDVPEGARALDLSFEFLSATAPDQGRVVVTPEMLNLQWNSTAFYPAGWYTRRIPVEASVILPDGWKFGVALDVAGQSGGKTTFKPVSFETLVDSPMFAGRYFRQVDLDPGGRSPIVLNIVADRPEQLEASAGQIALHRNLVVQADRLFGPRPFDRYDFLLALTDRMGGIGLEHHRSSENSRNPEYFTGWSRMTSQRSLLPHEYTHAWNGKFRRPADMWTPDYATPMRGGLLWVYEGQTQYWGMMLTARAGLWSKQEALDALAEVAATYQGRVGRQWRDTTDTTLDPVISARKPKGWLSWQRNEDYYSEGLLVWLDADTLIREKTGGKKSLDDFARAFFGGVEGDYTPKVYDFDEVVAALNGVVAHDWAGFLNARLASADAAPLDGFQRGGYRLVWDDSQGAYQKGSDTLGKRTDLTWSIGLSLNATGTITAVQWEGPAFKAGLTVSNQIIAVNGEAYSAERLKDVVGASARGEPIELIVKAGEKFKVVKLAWSGGLRYPRLERIPGTPDRLGDILSARKK